MARVRQDVWICDAPECDYEELATDEPPSGYSGVVSERAGTGVLKEPWYACCRDHITPAIVAVSKAAYDRGWMA